MSFKATEVEVFVTQQNNTSTTGSLVSPVVARDKGQPADRARVGEPLPTSRTLSAWLSLSGSEGCHLSSCWLVGSVEMGGKVDSPHGDRLPCQPGVGTTAHGGSRGSQLMKPRRWGRGGWTMPSGHPHACTGPGPARQRARWGCRDVIGR